jgi:PAS domain S-box-containing protein
MERADRIGDQLESLWEKLADLKRLESSLSTAHATAAAPASEQIKAEIENRLGFFPPLFTPALEFPSLLESFWRQQLASYYSNPLPELFKEKLAVRLSRYSASPYFIITHACMLRQLGMTEREVREFVETPLVTPVGLEQAYEVLAQRPHPLTSWPVQDTGFEESLTSCCAAVFLETPESARCSAELKDLLGTEKYAFLAALLAGIKASHIWLEAHSEISSQGHPVVREYLVPLVQSEPLLADRFQHHRKAAGWNLPGAGAKQGIPEGEDRYRELFENASDIICTYAFDGKLLSINRAVERIAGYTRAEALEMKISDWITPEYSHFLEKLLDPQISGEVPLNYELEIFSKDGSRITLSLSTRPIFRGGKAVAVQGIARDITKRKKTEAALQEANQKLEAWVNELELRTREMTLLNEMGDILRACLTMEEAYHVIVRVAQQVFPVQVGVLYVITPARDTVEAVAVWGDPSLAEHSFSPQECWGLRRGRTHWA